MVSIVQKKMDVDKTVYEMLQIISDLFTDTTNLGYLFEKPNYNIDNELNDTSEPFLF